MSEREAAAHVLDRLAFGARPGEVERVVGLGIEQWIDAQIAGSLDETVLADRLAGFDALQMTAREMVEAFPPPAVVRRRLGEERADELRAALEGDDEAQRQRARREMLFAMREEGVRPVRELLGQAAAQKVTRAITAENQLHEVLVDFWFNHFNVAVTDNQARPWILSYERDAIRPHVTGSFRDLLGATARHPAMLYYLDNASSRAPVGTRTELDRQRRGRAGRGVPGARANPAPSGLARGLNENYARELMELHTLGVDGGYSQDDVVAVARAFTGWTVQPPFRPDGMSSQAAMAGGDSRRQAFARRAGFVFDRDFVFHPGFHDAEPKTVLGNRLPAGGGVGDGERVLDLLAGHPATARHLATKLARRFVSDQPSPALIERLADRFLATEGDLEEVLRALFWSDEFWASRGAKIKSPFELAVSAVRATGARVLHPRSLVDWIARMGQPLHAYQAPSGHPDVADHWVNTGALLNRMSFGLRFAEGLPGIALDLEQLVALDAGDDTDGARMEPSTRAEALARWGAILLPERDLGPTIALLEPMALSPRIAGEVERAARAEASHPVESLYDDADADGDPSEPPVATAEPPAPHDAVHLVGLLLGSPEFQRR